MNKTKVPETCEQCKIHLSMGDCFYSTHPGEGGVFPGEGCPYLKMAAIEAIITLHETAMDIIRNDLNVPEGESVVEHVEILLNAANNQVNELRAQLAACAAGKWVEWVDGVLELPEDECNVVFDCGPGLELEYRGWFEIDTELFIDSHGRDHFVGEVKRYAIMGVRDE